MGLHDVAAQTHRLAAKLEQPGLDRLHPLRETAQRDREVVVELGIHAAEVSK